jgi:Zn-dependent protease with chaperone function
VFRLFAAAAVVTLVCTAVPLGAAEESGAAVERRFEVKVTPEMRHHSRIIDTLYFAGYAYSVAVLLLVLTTGVSSRLRSLARRIARPKFLTAMVTFAFFSFVTTLLEFPLSYYAGFHVPHQFDLTSQSFGGWIWDFAKAFAVDVVVGSVIVALALLAIRKVRRWWLVLWVGSIPLMFLAVVVAPIAFDPLFNRFEPLRDASLRDALLEEASRAGIEGSRVYQVDRSRQTRTMNAYVTGLGPTNRIVLWDTLLAKMSREEILAVMGHEMGHYVLRHIWKGLSFGILVSLVICFLLQLVYERGLARWGPRWGIEGADDPAAVPWLLVIVTLAGFLLSPVINGYSRRVEHEADVFGLELTHANEAMAASFVKFAEDSKVDPAPHPFIEFWRYSHPSLQKRIRFVLQYRPWERGEPNRAWRGR